MKGGTPRASSTLGEWGWTGTFSRSTSGWGRAQPWRCGRQPGSVASWRLNDRLNPSPSQRCSPGPTRDQSTLQLSRFLSLTLPQQSLRRDPNSILAAWPRHKGRVPPGFLWEDLWPPKEEWQSCWEGLGWWSGEGIMVTQASEEGKNWIGGGQHHPGASALAFLQ